MPHYYNGVDGTESPELEDKRLYQSLVGTLNYICSTVRPDVGFAVHYLSRKVAKPTVADMKRARRVLIYLRDTRTRSLVYSKLPLPEHPQVVCYVDASWGNGEKRKTICGYVIMLEQRVISAATKQQHRFAALPT